MKMRSKNMVRWQTAAILSGCLLTGVLHANIAIKPAYVEVNLEEGRPAGSFLISNVGTTEERFRINAIHFTFNEEGGLKKSQGGDFSLAPWIRFNPRELTLAPGTERAVRFAIVPKGKLAPGEYWAAMELESLNVNNVLSKEDAAGRSMKLKAITTMLVGIFGTVGNVSYEGEFKDLQLGVMGGKVAMKALVASKGSGRLGIKGDYEILDASGKVINNGPFAPGYVMRASQRWFTTQIAAEIPKGEYTVRVTLNAPHLEQPLVRETKAMWPDVPPTPAPASTPATAAAAVPAAEKPQPQAANPTDGNKATDTQGSAGSK